MAGLFSMDTVLMVVPPTFIVSTFVIPNHSIYYKLAVSLPLALTALLSHSLYVVEQVKELIPIYRDADWIWRTSHTIRSREAWNLKYFDDLKAIQAFIISVQTWTPFGLMLFGIVSLHSLRHHMDICKRALPNTFDSIRYMDGVPDMEVDNFSDYLTLLPPHHLTKIRPPRPTKISPPQLRPFARRT